MTTDERFDGLISGWLEEATPQRLPERVLAATFERTRRNRQQVGWRAILGRLQVPRVTPALGSTAVLVVIAAFAVTLFVNQQSLGKPGADLGIFEPVADRIVYEYQNGIWAVDPASSDPARTVQLASAAGIPLGWSSDGTRLLMMRGGQLFVLHADGSEKQLTETPVTARGVCG